MTSNERLQILARFIRGQVALADRPPAGCIQLNNEEATLCAEALERVTSETNGDGPLLRQLMEAMQRAKDARAKHDAGRVTDLHERDLRFMLTEIERLRGPVKSDLREMHERRAAEKGWPLPEKSNEKPSASTDDTPPAPTSSVECPKCRTQLAFEGDECGLCKEEES